jgi:hypothetical protein
MKNFNEILSRVKDLNKNIFIRKAELSDANSFVELFNLNYKRKTNSEYFLWQFFKSPFNSALFLAFEDRELIGFHGVKIYDVLTVGKVGFAIDFLIHEKARKKGVAILLDQYIRDFCFSNNTTIITALPNQFGNAAFKALGYNTLAKIDTLVLDISLNNRISVNNVTENKITDSFIRFEKKNKYLEWRFHENPMYSYDFLSLNDHCFLYMKIFINPENNESCGDIVHIKSDSTISTITLINLCIQKLKERGINSLTIWAVPHSNLFKNILDLGFKIEQNQRYFCLRTENDELFSKLDFLKWYLEESDAEIY